MTMYVNDKLLSNFITILTICDVQNHQTPLHLAASKGYTKIVKLLLEHGADPNSIDDKVRKWAHFVSLIF